MDMLSPLSAAPAMDSSCESFGDSGGDKGLRVAALFAILVGSTLGGVLPLVSRKANLGVVYFLGTVFAGGVVLATGFVHILPDAVSSITNPCLNFSANYPWAYVFAGGAAMFTFAVEYFLKQVIRRRMGLDAHFDAGSVFTHESDAETPGYPTGEEAKQHIIKVAEAENRVAAMMLEAGVIFHSIFIGIDLGLNSDPNVVRPLMIALLFHQGFEGLALGSTFIRANFSTPKYLCYLVGFVVVTPIGIAIGMGLNSAYNADSVVALGFEGAFNSVSAGILIYNGLVDLLLPTFLGSQLLVENRVLQVAAMGCMFAGFACMSLLAKWA